MKLPDRNLLDGSKTPVTSTAEMKAAQGDQRDFIAALLGTDSDDKGAARTNLDVPSSADEQAGKSKFGVAGGSGDAMTVALTPALLVLVDGMEIRARCPGANATTSPTLKVNDLPAVVITAGDGSVLPAGSYLAGWPATFRYRAPVSPSAARFELLNAVPSVAGAVSTVRQTVLSGALDPTGYPAMLAAGSGLALNLSAAAVAAIFSFAAGFSAAGEDNSLTRLAADVTGVVSGLVANNQSFVLADYVSPTAVNWGKTLALPQYGRVYDRSRQALLHFNGAAGSTSIIDDFGNSWSAQGGAKLQTNQAKFGGAGLGGGGGSNTLNGTTDYVLCTGITSMGGGSWSIRSFAYHTSMPGVGVFGAYNGSGFGANLSITSAGKTSLSLSSNGTSNDIANNTLGAATITTGSHFFYELTFDAVAGKYFLYVNGTLDQTITSTARVCLVTQLRIGAAVSAGSTGYMVGYMDEFEFLPYCDHPAGTSYAVPTAAVDATAAGYAADFFNTAEMKMYKLSAPASTVGGSPTFAAIKRLYVGEVVTAAVSITSIVTYAYRGQYDSGWTNSLPAGGVAVIKNHNIGVVPDVKELHFKCIGPDQGFSPGETAKGAVQASGVSHVPQLPSTPTTIMYNQGSGGGSLISKTGGWITPTTVLWAYRITANRGW